MGVAGLGAVESRPNIVLILADDLGWADAGCYGNQFNESPRIDRLAAEGVRFTQFYAGPVCSPTRANLQSGQDQARFGITQHIPGHRRPYAKLLDPAVPLQLPLEVRTIAESLADAGYATGYFGKWHLGGSGFGPGDQGWQAAEETKGHTRPAAADGSTPRTADWLARQGIAFMEKNRGRPFLLQLSHIAVHIPLHAEPERVAKFERKPPVEGYPSRADYAALLEELDESVGTVVDAVDRLGLAERTLILFVSDNGGLAHTQDGTVITSNAPLRGEKGTLYEGGVRVPCVARWQGVTPTGAVCETPFTTIDLYPTLLELSGANPPQNQPLDGASFAAALRDPAAAHPERPLFWHLPHYHHSTPAGSIRLGDWKLIEFLEDGSLELYKLASDLGESVNLAEQEAARAASMLQQMRDWRVKVGARMPVPNPEHDPVRETQIGSGGGERAKRQRSK
jgi:arylsulfatase A